MRPAAVAASMAAVILAVSGRCSDVIIHSISGVNFDTFQKATEMVSAQKFLRSIIPSNSLLSVLSSLSDLRYFSNGIFEIPSEIH